MPVPAGYDWALSTVGSKRHIRVWAPYHTGVSICNTEVALSLEHDTERVMAYPACKRCLQRTGGQE